MITGDLKSQIDRIWDAFWSGGIANPLQVIEQITYLLFIKRLDELHTLAEKKANRTGQPIESPVFDADHDHLRWRRFKDTDPESMFALVQQDVFPFIKALGESDSTYAGHMRDAQFLIPSPALLAKVVDLIDAVPMDDRDTKGDVYEYMLGKLSSAGQAGQFRTPRHIIQLMVELTAPTDRDTICDPACGTAGFLVAAGEYLRENVPDLLTDPKKRAHFHAGQFFGYDFDSTMLRIGSMNLMLHGVEDPALRYRDSLGEKNAGADEAAFSLILANPPFAGSLDYDACATDLQRVVKTKKTELLFLALFLRMLKPGGRAAVIVPDGVLFGSSKAHKGIRQRLVDDQRLDGIISLPSGVFKPYAGVSTAILLFTRTDSGGTDERGVWFYDMQADGLSLDDKRQPTEANDLPDILARWWSLNDAKPERAADLGPLFTGEDAVAQRAANVELEGSEADRPRTAQSFLVPAAEIREQDYDLSINRYKEIEYEAVEYDPPGVILEELRALEGEIEAGMVELEGLV